MAAAGKAGQMQTEPVYDRGVIPCDAGYDLTGSSSSQRSAFVSDNVMAVRISVTGAAARVKLTNVTGTVSATTGYLMQNGMTDVFRLRPGDTNLAYTGSGATINVVELA